MGEYEDWLRNKAAQDAREARERQAMEQRQRQNRLTAENDLKLKTKSEVIAVLKEPSDMLEKILREALASEFRKAREYSVEQNLGWIDVQYPYNSRNYVTAKWGEKLELTSSEKSLVEGKSGFLTRKPDRILDHRYQALSFGVGYRDISLSDYNKISIVDFNRNCRSIFPLIQKGLDERKINEEFWRKGSDGTYQTNSALAEQARRDAQDG